jgi:Fe-S-cluster containining protein
MRPPTLPAGDQALVQIMEAALADTTRRSGSWLVCRPGCTQCCIGVFSISQLDALRLRGGLDELADREPARAARIQARARQSVKRLLPQFPGNPASGILAEDEHAERRFEDFANDEPCPVLDPATGTCELYASRPITCRAFGPPVRSEQGLGVCELCFHGATDEQIAGCEMEVDPDDLESKLLTELEQTSGRSGRTLIAFALAD